MFGGGSPVRKRPADDLPARQKGRAARAPKPKAASKAAKVPSPKAAKADAPKGAADGPAQPEDGWTLDDSEGNEEFSDQD